MSGPPSKGVPDILLVTTDDQGYGVSSTFDVGVDTRMCVDERDDPPPFRFNGAIDKLTFHLAPEQLAPEERKVMDMALARVHD